jgi:hypothetical protein
MRRVMAPTRRGDARRTVGKGMARWLPIVGAVGVGAYAYIDTAKVAATAMDLFEGTIEVEAVEVVDAAERVR